jgi:DNA polymerase-3 subunit gamma/tau
VEAPTQLPSLPKANTRLQPKSTPNLKNIFNGKGDIQSAGEEQIETSSHADQPVTLDELKLAWETFAEQRKSQVAEYHLLKRDIALDNNTVTIALSNPVEEPLLQSIKSVLTTFLREKLGNNSISVVGEVMEIVSKKVAYTNKEKFDLLAEKNPILLELKERLGLDPDF